MSTTSKISETVSKKRGRPPVFDPGLRRHLASLVYTGVKTYRTMTAKLFETEAVGCLKAGDHEIASGVEQILDLEADVCRSTILEHLGRLKVESELSADDILYFARLINQRIVEDGATVREAVGIVRRLRAYYRDGEGAA